MRSLHGLGGSSLQLGRSLHSDEELIGAAASVVSRALLAVTLVPGIGTKDHLRRAAGLGAGLVRIATHCTEADVSVQHIALAPSEVGKPRLLRVGRRCEDKLC